MGSNPKYWNINQRNRGFTLVELLVAATIFIIVLVIVASAIVSGFDVYRRVRNIRAVTEDTQKIVELISNDAFASQFQDIDTTYAGCLDAPSLSSWTVYNPSLGTIIYTYSSGTLFRSLPSYAVEAKPIHTDKTQVSSIRICSFHSDPDIHARVTISMTMRSTGSGPSAVINTSTTFTQYSYADFDFTTL